MVTCNSYGNLEQEGNPVTVKENQILRGATCFPWVLLLGVVIDGVKKNFQALA